MKNIEKALIITIILNILLNITSSFLIKEYPSIGKYTTMIVIVVGIASLLYILVPLLLYLLKLLMFGRYAVLIFFLNSNHELLMIYHPFHKRLLPPGGRLKRWELPHDAVGSRLEEETGIKHFKFDSQFHNKQLCISEMVEDVICPYSVHMERRLQRNHVKFHYAFVYVCQFQGDDQQLKMNPPYNPRWLSYKQIIELPKDLYPFDDIVQRYKDILRKKGVVYDGR